MGKKCQVDDNVSSSDQISHGFASSVSDNKTSKQNSRDGDVSTVSSERIHSASHTFTRSDVSSGIGLTLDGKRKNPSVGTAEEINQGESTTVVPYPHKQLKADSSSSKNSGAVAQLSSVDSVDPKPACSLSNCGYSHPTQSVESKKVFQEPEYPMSKKSDPNATSKHCVFDLNEGIEPNGPSWHPKSVHETNDSSNGGQSSEPIPVMAKVGVPMGLPKQPLQFGGELGWKRPGIASAFRPTPVKNPDTKKESASRGFDLNVAATMDLEVPAEDDSVYVSSKGPERFQFNDQRGNVNCHRPATSGIDLNNNPMNEDTCKSIYPQFETRQLFRNCDTSGTVNCCGSSPSPYTSNSRPPYWVDLSSVRSFGQVQGQSFLLGAPTAEQVQMVVPIQLPHSPPGLYFGKVNNLNPTFYPSSVLPPPHNQPGAGALQPIPGPVLATYPGNIRLLENPQGLNLNPHAYANMRQNFLSNGTIALMENERRARMIGILDNDAGNSSEFLIPSRNPLFEERMKPVEQVACPASSIKGRETDAGWGASQINCRQMASWN